jgi:hypothetical protein
MQYRDSVTAILSDVENPSLEELFVNRDCKITLFLDKNDRAQYMKTVKTSRPVPQYPQMFPMMPMMQQGMMPMGMLPNMQPGMGMPTIPGMMPGMPGIMHPMMMQLRGNMRPPGN